MTVNMFMKYSVILVYYEFLDVYMFFKVWKCQYINESIVHKLRHVQSSDEIIAY